jgi:hypothetical protein
VTSGGKVVVMCGDVDEYITGLLFGGRIEPCPISEKSYKSLTVLSRFAFLFFIQRLSFANSEIWCGDTVCPAPLSLSCLSKNIQRNATCPAKLHPAQ